MKPGRPSSQEAPRVRGRPREFDCDRALEQAMRVFREKGYEGASMPMLTEAMGINRPSLYAAFGNKEMLFRKAVERYIQQVGGMVRDAIAQPTSREVVEALFRGVLAGICQTDGDSRGCMLVSSALACGDQAEAVRKELAARRGETEIMLRERLERARREADLPRGSNPAALAKFVATMMHGLSVQAASAATWKELSAAVGVAMQAWPT